MNYPEICQFIVNADFNLAIGGYNLKYIRVDTQSFIRGRCLCVNFYYNFLAANLVVPKEVQPFLHPLLQ